MEEIEEGIKEPDDVLIASLKIGKTFLVGMFVNLIVVGIAIYSYVYYMIKNIYKFLKFIRKKWRNTL
ncbi:hypothetical protein KHA80_21790 [Anaerobacillus sp. HL2]|nr:hypothetical protein KHA80_21790 [Anaerobacillus sp. HL2]